MNSVRILLAEDNPNDVQLTLSVLSRSNLTDCIEVVRDGVEALEFLTYRGGFGGRPRGNPELVMLDLKMPRMDGLQVLEAMRENDDLAKVPVVILTSSRENKDICRSYDLGANAYVVKPVEFEQFAVAIESIGVFWTAINESPPQNGIDR